MWQNGFSIDDGPLRAYNDQQNREFLNDVMMGRIPRELVREARGGEVMVNMEDHKDRMYEPPKVSGKYHRFTVWKNKRFYSHRKKYFVKSTPE